MSMNFVTSYVAWFQPNTGCITTLSTCFISAHVNLKHAPHAQCICSYFADFSLYPVSMTVNPCPKCTHSPVRHQSWEVARSWCNWCAWRAKLRWLRRWRQKLCWGVRAIAACLRSQLVKWQVRGWRGSVMDARLAWVFNVCALLSLSVWLFSLANPQSQHILAYHLR